MTGANLLIINENRRLQRAQPFSRTTHGPGSATRIDSEEEEELLRVDLLPNLT